VITTIDPTALIAERHIDSADLLWKVLRTQVDVVLARGAAVLNADDPLAVSLAELCDGEIVYFGCDGDAEALIAHRAGGGRWVSMRDDRVMLMQGEQALASLPHRGAAGLTASGGAPSHHAIEFSASHALIAAVAAAWAAGLAPNLIEAGLETLSTLSQAA
jgi:cyanophycin synthetase